MYSIYHWVCEIAKCVKTYVAVNSIRFEFLFEFIKYKETNKKIVWKWLICLKSPNFRSRYGSFMQMYAWERTKEALKMSSLDVLHNFKMWHLLSIYKREPIDIFHISRWFIINEIQWNLSIPIHGRHKTEHALKSPFECITHLWITKCLYSKKAYIRLHGFLSMHLLTGPMCSQMLRRFICDS